jgi:hypothetical protein
MALDQTFAKNLNDFIHGFASAPSITTGRKLKLCSNTGTASAAGTEITSGGNYTAGGVAITFTAATTASPSVSSNAALNITNMPAATVSSIELVDTSATPVRLEFGALSVAKTTNLGDTLSFTAGAITSALS